MANEIIVRPAVPVSFEQFGSAVAISGNAAIVGARSGGPGAAYVFEIGGSGLTQKAKLTASDPIGLSYFGSAVSIDGDYAIVGAPDAGSQLRGHAYIFHRSGSSWSEQALLTASDGTSSGAFGRSVAMNGDCVIVGANRAAYVFRRTGSNWVEEAKLTAPPPASFGSAFGTSVAVHGDYAIVGDPWAGGGVIVTPGGPRPIDPEPFREWDRLPSSKRDLIMGLALTEIASFIDDTETKQRVKEAGQDLTKKAAARAARSRRKDSSASRRNS